MKDVSFTLEFTRHVLANSNTPGGDPCNFQRDSRDNLIWQQSWWYSAFSKAIEMEGMRGVKAGDIHMDLSVQAPTEMYRRKYGRDKCRTHEAIMPGSQVTFNAVVADHITKSNLNAILERMGKYVGLSPFGYRLGFGKFNVTDVTVEPSDSNEVNNAATQTQSACGDVYTPSGTPDKSNAEDD